VTPHQIDGCNYATNMLIIPENQGRYGFLHQGNFYIACPPKKHLYIYTPVICHSNGKWTRIEDVFPIKDGDIPASYVSFTHYQLVLRERFSPLSPSKFGEKLQEI